MKHLARILALALLALPSAAHACTVCMGDPNSKSAGAINGAIFLMLGVIGSTLAALVAFGFNLARRAAAPLPPHASLDQSNSDTDELS